MAEWPLVISQSKIAPALVVNECCIIGVGDCFPEGKIHVLRCSLVLLSQVSTITTRAPSGGRSICSGQPALQWVSLTWDTRNELSDAHTCPLLLMTPRWPALTTSLLLCHCCFAYVLCYVFSLKLFLLECLTDAEYAARNQRGDIIGEKEGEGIRCWYTRQNVESVAQQVRIQKALKGL